jgi:hypothetical protein
MDMALPLGWRLFPSLRRRAAAGKEEARGFA